MRTTHKVWTALGATVLFGAAATVYTVNAMAGNPPVAVATESAPIDLAEPGRLLFRHTAPGPAFGKVASVPITDPGGPRRISALACDRFYTAAASGLCLASAPGILPSAVASRLDARLTTVSQVEVAGVPSRAKLSADGRMATWTTFVTGDSYTQGNSFSTRTAILNQRDDQFHSNIETIPLRVEGKRYQSEDINVWGGTFAADDNRFYATVATAGETHLIEGDYAAWSARALKSNVECPSLSPDGTKLSFKKRVSTDGARPWREYVLDLATMQETELAETRSIDDQALWLDADTVAYELPREGGGSDIWAVPADGTGSPRLLVEWGSSPSTS